MKKYIFVLFTLFCITMTLEAQNTETPRNPKWGTLITEVPMDNFYKIDEGVYRSEQPTADEFKLLEEYGIKEVLNLRNHNSDDEEAKETNLILRRVKMQAFDIDHDEVVEALRKIKNKSGAILIHCKHGSDRTGLIVALYRILYQGWTREEALDEMLNGGYGHHKIFFNIGRYLRNVDIEKVRSDVNK